MLSLEQLLTFALASVLLTLIPGPTVLFVIGRSLSLGRRAGLWSVVGNTLGLLPIVVAVALGVGALVAESVVVFTVVKVVGAAYLIYLGVQAFRHRGADVDAVAAAPRSTLRIVRDGFVVGVSNPKAVVFLAAVLPAVRRPLGRRDQRRSCSRWAWSSWPSRWSPTAATRTPPARRATGSAARPDRLKRMQATGGLMMIGLGGSLALTGQK